MRLCAGWLAVVGQHHLGIRMQNITGCLPDDAFVAGPDWPRLHANLDDLVSERAKQMAPAVSAARPDRSPSRGRQQGM